ncbi:hypothetical protein [uncultured Cellulomonas sp.]|uniref:hypothetical protein n=1 Tax=uncultured Cellulomonas sp. TaxID=189682 RepID=UPI002629B58F|nr:hypothetical protein [uncultured Cellulomonas sp.]
MIDRGPTHAFHTGPLEHGSLVRLDPGDDAENATLVFPFNPETVTRSRTGRWEPRRRRRAADAVPTPQQVRGGLGGHGASALLAEAETISFRLVLDATETILRSTARSAVAEAGATVGAQVGAVAGSFGGPGGAAAGAAQGAALGAAAAGGSPTDDAWRLGVLPELAFLEQVSLGREAEEQVRGGQRPAPGTPIRPIKPDELLLTLGTVRWFPCVLTELSITEQRFTPELVPVRAEVDLKLTVLEPVENTYNPLVRQTFDQLLAQRTERLAGLGTTSSAALRSQLGGEAMTP